MTMKVPSTLLLRALLRPHQPLCQVRWKGDWMPREKYAKITLLDKLHRRQKAASKKQRHDSHERAKNMYPDTLAPPPSPIIESSTPNSSGFAPTICTLPYLLTRTKSSNLPIYESSKAGGSKHITTVRKIKGDLTEFATAMRSALKLDEFLVDMRGRKKQNVTINFTTKQVVVRGWRGPEIKRWAEMSGF